MKTYREIAERYLKRPSKRLNRPKGEMCIRYVGYAITRFADRPIDSFKKSDVTNYVEDMQDEGLANGTINTRVRYFLAVLNYAKNDIEIIGSFEHDVGIWLCSLYSRADSEALAAPAVPYWDGRGLVPCRSSTTAQAARLTSQVAG